MSSTAAGRLFFKFYSCSTFFMKSSTKNVVRKRPGRPATGQDPVTAIRLSARLRENVDVWAAKQDDAPSRSEAIRRLVELGLTVKTKARGSDRLRAARAADQAAEAIDSLTVGAANTDEQAGRRRRLLKEPEEFRDARVDRPKAKGK